MSFVESISKAGFNEKDFSFTKKRGVVQVVHNESSNNFKFFRKTETILNDEKQWKKTSSYKFGISEAQKFSEKFEEVLVAFEKWLKTL